MSRFTLLALGLALAGCAPMQPDGCEKASAVNDCVYAWHSDSNVPMANQPPNLGCDGQVFYERPHYSASAKADKREGEVSATFDVDDKGKARNIVLKGTPEFYRDTKSAIARSCWIPGRVHETALFTFKLSGDAETNR
ncbi:energy transducer TonB [Serratia ureilytica]|uniref:energy transducer TonB n=1 Tax=Serratia ureilytica TaxID=300181 RepID=UPI00313CBC65